jgi:hypothetical protein
MQQECIEVGMLESGNHCRRWEIVFEAEREADDGNYSSGSHVEIHD